MAVAAASSLQITATNPSYFSAKTILKGGALNVGITCLRASWAKLSSASHISSGQHFHRTFTSSRPKCCKAATKAISQPAESKPESGLCINLKGL